MAGAGYIADALNVGTSIVAPGAGVTVATLGIVPAGTYEIRIRVNTGVGAVAADNGNMNLQWNGVTDIGSLPVGVEVIVPRKTLNGTNSVQVRAQGAATAGVVYTACITATQVD